jgi:tetratricopeptide (TPR) repeat protein
MKGKLLTVCLTISLSIISFNGFSQSKLFIAKFAEGNDYFNVQNFRKALKCFLYAESIEKNQAEVKYNIGVCFLKTEYKFKALPYFETVFKLKK